MELEILDYAGEGYRRLVDGPKWTLAVINYAPRFDPANFTRLERHLLTDETFVLLSGDATLTGGSLMRLPVLTLPIIGGKGTIQGRRQVNDKYTGEINDCYTHSGCSGVSVWM